MIKMNQQFSIPGLQKIMAEFQRENEKAELTQEMMGEVGRRRVVIRSPLGRLFGLPFVNATPKLIPTPVPSLSLARISNPV